MIFDTIVTSKVELGLGVLATLVWQEGHMTWIAFLDYF